MTLALVESLLVVFGISALIIYLLGKLKLPSIVGFLVAGTIIGPYGLGLIQNTSDVETIAEIGVIFLMFTIGVEFSLSKLSSLKKEVFLFGTLQLLFTALLFTLFALAKTTDLKTSIFYGFVFSLSSTAIVLKLLLEKGELNTRHGKISLGILLFQDISVVPLMFLTAILSAETKEPLSSYIVVTIKAFLTLFLVFLLSRTAVPYILHEVVRTRARELFILVTLFICLATAYVTSRIGLSLALGAFLAGIIISESEYSSQALSDITPFKEIFSGIFFISIGMLLDTRLMKIEFFEEMLLVGFVIIVKIVAVFFVIYPFFKSLKLSLRAGFFLAHVGEFSFVLFFAGKGLGLIGDREYQTFITIAVISMILAPAMILHGPRLIDALVKKKPFHFFEKAGKLKEGEIVVKKTNHVIVVGFGLNGKNLASVLKDAKIPYVVLELNPDTVRKAKRKGEPIYFGDGTSPEILRKLGISSAKVIVVAISDPTATRRIVEIARAENPEIHIIVRTRFVSEIGELLNLGANEVIPEEFETSLEIFARVLHYFGTPRNRILEYIDRIRKEGYKALLGEEKLKTRVGLECIMIEGLDMESYIVEKGSWLIGKTIKSVDLRAKTGATIIAINRKGSNILNPDPQLTLDEGDVIIYLGVKEQLQSAFHYLSGRDK